VLCVVRQRSLLRAGRSCIGVLPSVVCLMRAIAKPLRGGHDPESGRSATGGKVATWSRDVPYKLLLKYFTKLSALYIHRSRRFLNDPSTEPCLTALELYRCWGVPKIHSTLRHFVWHLRNVRLRGCLLTFQFSSWIITPCVLPVTVLSTFWLLLVFCFVINHTQVLIPKCTKGRYNFTHWKSELLSCRYQRWCALVAYFPSLKGGKSVVMSTVPCGCVSWKVEPVDRFSRNLEDCTIGTHSYAIFLNFLPSLLNI